MRLSVKGVTIAGGLIWGGAILLVGLLNMVSPGYGASFLQLTRSVYPSLSSSHVAANVLIGTIYGLIDGAIAALIFAWLYNAFAGGPDKPQVP